MPSDDYVLAIDLGTSGPKVALVSATGRVRGGEFNPIRLELLPGGGAEQDPAEWWQAISAACRRLVAEHPAPAARIAAISVTAQWSGTVAVSAAGDPIGNAVIWMDSRGAPYIEELIRGPVRVEGYDPRKLRSWVKLTGGAPSRSGKDPLAHILYLRRQHPNVYAATATFLEPKDYLNLRLTGETAASFDSIALHWVADTTNPSEVTYAESLLHQVGLDRSRLPRLLPATDILGTLTPEAAADLGLDPGIPVVVGTPDLHSAAIGAGTTTDLAAHLYLGTSSWLICHVPFKKTDIIHNIGSLPAAIPGRYLAANEQETAGKALEWLSYILYPDRLDRDTVYEEMNDIASGVPAGSNGVIFTPWLYGERTPVEDSALRGGFFNQELGTGRREMIRAVFEGVAYNSRWLLGHVERFCRTRLDPIVVVGGGARSALWCQIHADVLGRTIHQAEDPIMVNVRGAGLLAHVALGNVTWDDVPALVPIAASYRPDPGTADVYDRLYDGFRRIHRANRRIYRSLNG
jgi:xylulokinase